MKILVIGTGGTIASTKSDLIRLDNPFKIIDYIDDKDIELDCVSPYSVLSENVSVENWQSLIDTICDNVAGYDGIIILHGSDTLAYTSSLVANVFPDESIVLVASNKPIEDEDANGIDNMKRAIDQLKNGTRGVYVSYDGLFPADQIVSADSEDKFIKAGKQSGKITAPRLKNKNILVIKPYVNINYNNYNIDGVDAVLHEMYHSATAPSNVAEFAEKCRSKGVPFYFVTPKASADYESAEDFTSIIFSSTLENAYVRLLLK